MTAVLTVMSGLDPHSIRITLGWLVNWDDVWLQVDSCVVLAWICEYGDGLYTGGLLCHCMDLQGIALLHGLAVSNTLWGLGMVHT